MNHDPARFLQRGGAGTHAGGHGGRVAPPDSADTGGWHTDAGSVARVYGTLGCSNDVHDRNGRRRRTMTGIRRESKTEEGEPLRCVSSCRGANGTRQRQRLRGTLKVCLAGVPFTRVALQEPRRFQRRGSILLSALESKYTTPDE